MHYSHIPLTTYNAQIIYVKTKISILNFSLPRLQLQLWFKITVKDCSKSQTCDGRSTITSLVNICFVDIYDQHILAT